MAAEQQALSLGHISSRQFEPVREAVEGAARYTKGKHSIEGLEHTKVNPPRGFRVRQAYKAAETAPEAPGIRESYESMRHSVNDQYAFMTRPKEQGGMGIRHDVVEADPYQAPDDVTKAQKMAEDVHQGRIQTFSTKSTGGHTFFSDEENDRFRAVHDVFGHAATGRGFSRHAEEAAFLSHRQMFPKKAIPALASETRGQNSYFNYSGTKTFPDQSEKLIGLPSWANRK
jgi:hypothetical protein